MVARLRLFTPHFRRKNRKQALLDLESIRTLTRGYAKVNPKTVPRAAAGSETDDELACIQSALLEYSKARPQQLTRYVVATGAQEYSLTSLITGWTPVLHTLHNIRVNVGEAGEYNADPRDWHINQKADGTYWLRFRQFAPNGTIGLEYYAPHVLTSAACTIFAPDEQAFAHLAASYVLQTAANSTAENARSTITADAVSQGEQSKAYAFQAKDEFAKWEAHLVAVRSNASSVRLNWDLERTAHNGYGRFWNRRGRLGL